MGGGAPGDLEPPVDQRPPPSPPKVCRTPAAPSVLTPLPVWDPLPAAPHVFPSADSKAPTTVYPSSSACLPNPTPCPVAAPSPASSAPASSVRAPYPAGESCPHPWAADNRSPTKPPRPQPDSGPAPRPRAPADATKPRSPAPSDPGPGGFHRPKAGSPGPRLEA